MFNTRNLLLTVSLFILTGLPLAQAVSIAGGTQGENGISDNLNNDSISDVSSLLCSGFQEADLAECESLLNEQNIAPPRPDAATISATQTYTSIGDDSIDDHVISPPPSSVSSGSSSGGSSIPVGSVSSSNGSSSSPDSVDHTSEIQPTIADTPDVPAVSPIAETLSAPVLSDSSIAPALTVPAAPTLSSVISKPSTKLSNKTKSNSIPLHLAPSPAKTAEYFSTQPNQVWQDVSLTALQAADTAKANLLQNISTISASPSSPDNSQNPPVQALTLVLVILATIQTSSIGIFYLLKLLARK